MIGTLTRASFQESGKTTRRPRLTPRSPRRPKMLIGSLALLVACMALFVGTYDKASHQISVVAVDKPVAQGAVIEASDLTVARLSASGALSPISAAEISQIVGRRAAVGLVPGGILTVADLARAVSVPVGEAVVGVAAKPSQLPAEGVFPGEKVDVVLTGTPGSPALAATSTGSPSGSSSGSSGATASANQVSGPLGVVLTPQATVTDVATGLAANSDLVDVSLLVPASVAPVIATASAAGQVALVAVAAPS